MKTVTFKAKISENKKDKATDVILEGDLSLRNAVDIRNAIKSIKQDMETVRFELRNVEKLDITIIQTISACSKLLSSKGSRILIRTEFTPETDRLLRNAGFDLSNLN